VFSAEFLDLQFDLESISNDEFRYGAGWSVDATLSYSFKSYNDYGEYIESQPQPVYSTILSAR